MGPTVSFDDLTDEQLALTAAERDSADEGRARSAFESLYGRHARLLIAFLASRVARSEIEDVHQVVWLKVWQALPGGFQGGNFRAWLHQIARNYLIDRQRKRTDEELADGFDQADSKSIQPLKSLLLRERSEALQRCLETLEPAMAQIIAARLAGEDYEEICARTKMTPAQAHKLFHRAKQELMACAEGAFA